MMYFILIKYLFSQTGVNNGGSGIWEKVGLTMNPEP